MNGDLPANHLREGHAGGYDEHAINTPEQVDLRFPLAGIGSRFLALLLDFAIQFAANILLVIIVAVALAATSKAGALNRMSEAAGKWFVAGIILIYFLLFWGYFSLFEAFSNGQTPGKRVLKIRVIKDSGRQITFFEALARNLLRVVDALPGVYLVGVLSILLTKSNKRLGDLVADTLVVHERVDNFAGYLAVPFAAGRLDNPAAADLPGGLSADRIALLRGDDLRLIDSYLARAFALPMETRANLASRLLDGLCRRMEVAVPTESAPERTLEAIAHMLRGSRRR